MAGPVTDPTPARLAEGTVLVAVHTTRPEPGWLERVAGRLLDCYRPVLGERTGARVRATADGRAGVITVEPAPPTEPLPDVLVWGVALGADGSAGPADLRRLLDRPQPGHALLGRHVVARIGDDGARLVTAPDLVQTLAHAGGPHRDAWATRELAAAVAADAPLRLAPAHVPERVTFEFVFGDDSLLDGVRTLPEASVVDLTRDRHTEGIWWPVADRLAPGPPTTPASLRDTLARSLLPVVAVDGATLAMTAGRDSLLVASVLAGAGRGLPTFTIGGERLPDAQGAAAVATRLGWSHRLVGSAPDDTWSLARVPVGTRWTDGADTPWNLMGPALRWPTAGALWLAGSGGEIGRAVYRTHAPADPVRVMAEGRASAMSPRAAADLWARVAATVDESRLAGRHPLDVLHARGRTRKWLGRARPVAGVHGVVAAYTGPAVVRALLDAPDDERLGGSLFDAALAADGVDLRSLARRAVVLPPPPGRLAQGWQRLRRSRPGLPGRPVRTDIAPLDAAIRAVCRPGGPTRTILGDRWWAATTRRARHDPAARRWLWGAVAVDALAELLDVL